MVEWTVFQCLMQHNTHVHFKGWGRAKRGGDRRSRGSWLMKMKLEIKILTHFLDKKYLPLTARTTTSCFCLFWTAGKPHISNKGLSQPQISPFSCHSVNSRQKVLTQFSLLDQILWKLWFFYSYCDLCGQNPMVLPVKWNLFRRLFA